MIVDGILLIAQGFLNILLSPLTLVNIAVDLVSSITIVNTFLRIIAYVLPWSNILPIILIILGIFTFRCTLAFIKTIWHFVPFIGN